MEDRAVSRRMRALALHARDHAGTPHLTGILRQLETAGHGRLAVHMAAAARDTDTLALHLAGPDPELRRAALRALREPSLPDEAVPPVLDDAPTGLRRALYRTLYHARRTGLADSLLSRVRAEYGDAEAAALLPACSPERVAEHLPGLRHAVRSWRRLARRHPDALLDLLRRTHARGGWTFERFRDLRRVLQALDPVRPAELGSLLGELGEERRDLALLAPHTHRLLYRDGDERRYSTRYPAGPGGTRDTRRLLRHARHTPAQVLPVLRAMPLPVRTAHLDRIARRGDGRAALLLLPYLDLLPRDRAEAEARRALAEITAFQSRSARYGDPDQDLDAIAHLPYGEAAGPLEEAASAGDPDRRARGLARLVEATARTGDPHLLARVLTERAERSRAERDPVRRSLLRALSRIAPALLARASLPALHRLLADTLGSRDTSADTRRALRDLAAALLRHPLSRREAEATDWALEAYTGLVARFGARGLGEPGRPRSEPSALRAAFDTAGERRAADAGAWVPDLDRPIVRDWPETLRARVADHLAGITDDPSQTIDDRERALRALAALPGAADRLAPYLDGPDTVLREAALSALGRCDEPERALGLVLAHADGPRSRAAGPAMSRCAMGVAPSHLGPALCRALDGPAKVTVRRTAARLLEHHRLPGGIEHLARVLDTGDGLHRDVRAAVAGALMRALDHPAALPALTRHAPGFTPVEIQFAVLRVSPLTCPPSRRKGAARVVASLPEPSRDHWRFSGWTGRWAPWTDHDLDALAEAVCDMERDGERAIRAFEQLLADGRGTDRISGMLARLLSALPGPGHGVPARGPRREAEDSAHRRVRRLVGLLQSRMSRDGDRDPVLREQVDAVLGMLGTRKEFAPEALLLVQRRIGNECEAPDGAPRARRLVDLLLAGAHLLARGTVGRWELDRLLMPVQSSYGESDIEPRTREEVVRRLFAAASVTQGAAGETAALVGLRLVERAGGETGWAGPWPELLSRAGDLGHERVRDAAWRMVV
ncbi:hypothetical protein MRI28_00835 [Nocardiopsis dassonvillei]|uniref:hypothetical protein n=1 Tax=Nocardiopsis dassonvillei TaxID=2014 RepID=UPI00200E7CE4|nr:hypothetical protein [Nocardiopsis dassonvillei]MCK9868214.1 hypothetical protein [Nocardiopsis dassonvillei]